MYTRRLGGVTVLRELEKIAGAIEIIIVNLRLYVVTVERLRAYRSDDRARLRKIINKLPGPSPPPRVVFTGAHR